MVEAPKEGSIGQREIAAVEEDSNPVVAVCKDMSILKELRKDSSGETNEYG